MPLLFLKRDCRFSSERSKVRGTEGRAAGQESRDRRPTTLEN
jgi:hypothetical protein